MTAPDPAPSPQLDPLAKLKHDLANPLSALLAEVQLLRMGADRLDGETREALAIIEQLAVRMRTLLRS
ncbi:MAG: histidine kinase dimerization/phospho-acceptor domain-containing protein [Gemmatimonadales bacterium]|nr:histidine kinase dimerization/phospho-acceptor domain-containing protein [Gemmatimonadales bacterium]